MTTFGSPRSFGIRLRPLSGSPPDGDAAATATWVSLELWVTGDNLTAHTHESEQTVHEGLHWPAIYFARWLVRSWQRFYERARWPWAASRYARSPQELLREWDARIAEAEPPDDELDERDTFVETHFLEAGAAGGLVPAVTFTREDETIVVTWDNRRSASHDVTFHRSYGQRQVDAGAFAEAARGFVTWVHGRLPPNSEDAVELLAWLSALDSPSRGIHPEAVQLPYDSVVQVDIPGNASPPGREAPSHGCRRGR